MTRNGVTRGCAALAVVIVATGEAAAQSWPSRPIEIAIPFSAGSGMDSIGRAVSASFAEQLGQSVVVINREGAAGTLAFTQLAAAAPDGYSLAFGPTTPIANAPYLVKGVKYDSESFDYICQVYENVYTAAVPTGSRFKTAQDLIRAAKAEPEKITYGHNGPGSIPNLSAETLASDLGLKFTGIPFRGDTGLMPVLLKGDIDFGMLAVPTLQGGKGFRPLVTFAKERDPAFPDTPAARELGVTSSVSPGYNGVFAPKGLPAPVRAALAKVCAATVVSAPFTRMMGDLGIAIRYLDGTAFHDLTVEDYKTKGELIRRLGMGGAQ